MIYKNKTKFISTLLISLLLFQCFIANTAFSSEEGSAMKGSVNMGGQPGMAEQDIQQDVVEPDFQHEKESYDEEEDSPGDDGSQLEIGENPEDGIEDDTEDGIGENTENGFNGDSEGDMESNVEDDIKTTLKVV